MRTFLRGKVTLLFMMLGMLIAIPAVALAAELVTSELDTVTPNAVTVEQGGTTNFNIGLAATGAIASTITSSNASTATVDTAYSLNNTGAVSGSTPSSAFKFYSSGTGCGGTNCDVTWATAPTPYSVGASVSAASTTPVGDYSLVLSDSANTTDLTNPSGSGGKLGDTAATTITVHVVAPPPPSDTTAPVITPDVQGTQGQNGWYTSDVDVSWTVTDAQSTITSKSASCDTTTTINTDTTGQTVSCTATSAGGTDTKSVTIKRDATAPVINDDGTTQSPNGAGWFNTAVSNNFSASDATSGLANSGDASFSKSSTTEGSAVKINSGPVSDNAGNTNAGIDSAAFKIDLTKPVVTVTGVSNGATYTLGSVPAAGCSTTDALSGVKTHASLAVTGGPVGSVTAKCDGAVDNADNTNSASVTYNVEYAWTGFFRPVDNLPTLNTVKAGSSVPVKFSLAGNQGLNIFASGSPASKVAACDAGASTDAIEETVTAGNSSLSYDATADQYNYVWKTEKAWAGTCRQLQVKLADGTTHAANFKLLK
jgi:hypothetical protein